MLATGHSRFPAVGEDKDDVLGILLAKDLLRGGVADNGPGTVRELLRPAVLIPESKKLNLLLKEFRLSRNHMAIVVDEYGGVSGLLTIEDTFGKHGVKLKAGSLVVYPSTSIHEVAPVTKGARRWLNLGFMRIQPSELLKIAMPLLLAWFFQKREAMQRASDYAIAAVMLLYMAITRMRGAPIDMECVDTIARYLFYAFIIDFALESLDLLDWKSMDRAMEIGYRNTCERLADGELERLRAIYAKA